MTLQTTLEVVLTAVIAATSLVSVLVTLNHYRKKENRELQREIEGLKLGQERIRATMELATSNHLNRNAVSEPPIESKADYLELVAITKNLIYETKVIIMELNQQLNRVGGREAAVNENDLDKMIKAEVSKLAKKIEELQDHKFQKCRKIFKTEFEKHKESTFGEVKELFMAFEQKRKDEIVDLDAEWISRHNRVFTTLERLGAPAASLSSEVIAGTANQLTRKIAREQMRYLRQASEQP